MGGVPIVRVVRRELEIPAQFAGLDVESNEGASIEIVARTNVAIPVRTGIADAPVHQLQFGIVGARNPSGAAPRFPCVAGPGLVARLVGTGDSPEAPGLRTGFRVVGVDESANAGFAATNADDNFPVDSQRRHGHAVAELVIEHFGRPAFGAALQIERQKMAVESSNKKFVIQNGGATIGVAEADGVIVRRNRTPASPERGPCGHQARRRSWGR